MALSGTAYCQVSREDDQPQLQLQTAATTATECIVKHSPLFGQFDGKGLFLPIKAEMVLDGPDGKLGFSRIVLSEPQVLTFPSRRLSLHTEMPALPPSFSQPRLHTANADSPLAIDPPG